jgi:lysophospholipase L1-like esterase
MRRLILTLTFGMFGCFALMPIYDMHSAPNYEAAAPADAQTTAGVTTPPVNTIILPTVTLVSKRLPRNVLIVGDSEACAVSSYINLKKLVATINDEDNHHPHDVVNVDCKGGTVVQYWGAGGHMKLALQKYPHPDAVLVFLGTNHYWQDKVPPTQTVTDLLKDTNCVWVGNTAVHGKYWKINHLIYEAVTPQCSYFDTETADIPLADGVHPTPAGATKWIRAVWPMIPHKYEDSDE